MKRKSLLFILVLFLGLAIAGCKKKNGGGNGKEPEEIPNWQIEEVTLTFATWAYNNAEVETIDSLMVKEFTKKYPNITVNMQIVGESAVWDENMLQLLETEEIPDVFLVNRMENFLPYGILADLTEYFDADPDTEYIFDSVKDLGLYKGRRYVIPTYLYPQFWVVNLDLLRDSNVAIPSYDWTWDQMEAIAKTVQNDTTHKIGVFGTAQYFYEYPKVINAEVNPYAYGYNGTKFNFNTPSYMSAMNRLEIGIQEGYVVNAITPEQALEYYGDATIDPRYSGHVGIWREASWSVKEHLGSLPFHFDIYSAPSGIGMGNTDIAGVSALSPHKEAAYQLLKWMSFSEEGVIRRFELYEEYKDELFISGNNYPYPIVDYGIDGKGNNKIWDNIPYGSTAPGLVSPQFMESLRNAAIQANKEVIGWDAVDQAVNPYFGRILMGEADFVSQMEAIQADADAALQRKRTEIDNSMNK